MDKLDGVPVATLRKALERAEDAKAAKRLMIAIAYRDGVDVATLSDRYGLPESTIYYWLDRFEEQPVDAAATDDSAPGRPAKLAPEQRELVGEWLRRSPREQGVDAAEWTPELLRKRIRQEFGVDYSLGHVRRLLREEYKIQ